MSNFFKDKRLTPPTLTLPLILIGLLFLSFGCQTTKNSTEKKNLLGDHSSMERSFTTKQVYFYINPEAGDYSTYIFDPVLIFLNPSHKGAAVSANLQKQLSQIFKVSVAKTLKGRYRATDKAGPGTLRLRTALVNVVPSESGNSFKTLDGISMEAEFVDSITGKRIGSIYHHRQTEGLGGSGRGTLQERTMRLLKKWAALIRAGADQIELR